MKIKQQHGFGLVEGLLIFVIVGIIGGTGWYVMNANKNADASLKNAGLGDVAKSSKKKQTSPPSQADPTSSWVAYSSKDGEYSLKYPSGWYKAVPIDGCVVGDTLLLLGANKDSTGKYCSDAGGQILISSSSSTDGKCPSMKEGDGYKNVKSEVITAGNASGIREYGIASGQLDNGGGIGALEDGSIRVAYCFNTNSRSYYAEYRQKPNYTNVLSDFDLMVTKTLKFSS